MIAAEIAAAAGVATVITSSRRPQAVCDILEYHAAHGSVRPRPVFGGPSSGAATPTISGTATPMASHQPDPLSSYLTDPAPSAAAPDPEIPRPPHTLFTPSPAPLRDVKAWTTHTLRPAGAVLIDGGAHAVLARRESGGRLLPAGVLAVRGVWAGGQAVRVVVRRRRGGAAGADEEGADAGGALGDADEVLREDDEWEEVEVGRGLANYNSEQIEKVKGRNRCARAISFSRRVG